MKDLRDLPATHMCIDKWNEPCLPLLPSSGMAIASEVAWFGLLAFNVPFQHKYGYIRDMLTSDHTLLPATLHVHAQVE